MALALTVTSVADSSMRLSESKEVDLTNDVGIRQVVLRIRQLTVLTPLLLLYTVL